MMTPTTAPFRHQRGFGRVALGSCFLGFILGGHLVLGAVTSSAVLKQWSIYAFLTAMFHLADFFVMTWIQPAETDFSGMLLDHSPEYGCACLFALVEFWTEAWLEFPPWKHSAVWVVLGALFGCGGLLLRYIAMLTATDSFTHLVAREKRDRHVLVSSGVYHWLRHPAYTGWYIWAVSSQVILANPIAIVGFAVAGTAFFQARVPAEEEYLLAFFGEDYLAYASSTYVGIPGVRSSGLFREVQSVYERDPTEARRHIAVVREEIRKQAERERLREEAGEEDSE